MTTKPKPVLSVSTVEQQCQPWQFKPGKSGNPKGRPKGSRNKLAEDFIADAFETWKEQGRTALTSMATAEPAKFCQMIAGLMPRELAVKANGVEELSDVELAAGIALLKRLLVTETAGTH